MTPRTNQKPHASTPLAGCIGALFCLPAVSAIGATHTVSNCNDSGSGSLRAVVNASTTHSGDTLDMTTLTCSMISLKTGIVVAQKALTLNGPGENKLTITAYGATKHRMLRHTGYGILKVNNMSITHGYAGTSASAPPSQGGCIVSNGSVNLVHALVTACAASGTSTAAGGGISAVYTIYLQHSTLSGNTATTGPGGSAVGGGATTRAFSASDSSVVGNSAEGGSLSGGGGLYVATNLALTASTISGNHTNGVGGGGAIGRSHSLRYLVVPTVTINNSTISGNDASYAGGIYSEWPVTLQNSTIAFNTAGFGNFTTHGHVYFIAAGLAASGPYVGSVELQSSLIANNTYGTFDEESDFSTFTVSGLGPAITVSGANNLIRVAHGPEPAGTLHGCPLLGPLRDNGGETKTHALLSHSPGIDAGNNSAGFTDDQRGSPFVRAYGIADIGAYEVQADIIFDNGFDGCPLLSI